MNRLVHPTFDSHLRKMQMSEIPVFVFTEGKTDKHFYGEICDSVCQPHSLEYALSSPDQITGSRDAGGKPSLLSFFHFLEGKNALMNDFKGKRTVALFYVDKDVDDLINMVIESPHICYTEFYTLENHIFREADIHTSVSTSACVQKSIVMNELGLTDIWRENASNKWKDWVKLCLFAKMYDIRSRCNYSNYSSINDQVDNTLDDAQCRILWEDLEAKFQHPQLNFDDEKARVSAIVENYYQSGTQDVIFKGKWYTRILTDDIKNMARRRNLLIEHDSMEKKIRASATATLDFTSHWANHFKAPLVQLIQML